MSENIPNINYIGAEQDERGREFIGECLQNQKRAWEMINKKRKNNPRGMYDSLIKAEQNNKGR